MLERKEALHQAEVLERAKTALLSKDSSTLRELSNETIHSSCSYQNPASLTIAVLVYALSKLIERNDNAKIKDWNIFVKKLNSLFSLTIMALRENKEEAYERHLQKARKTLETISPSLRHYIEDVLYKAGVNKASKIYEHGISLGKTAELLGVTQWELSQYAGQKTSEQKENFTISTKERAKMALEFFEK